MWLLHLAIEIYRYVLLAAVLASWIPDAANHPVVRFLDKLTEPVLAPLRRVIPSVGGIDISPLLVFFGLGLLQRYI